MDLARGDQIESAEERLVYRGQQHSAQHHADQNAVVIVEDGFAQLLAWQLFNHGANSNVSTVK
jgi:hypothetical protein